MSKKVVYKSNKKRAVVVKVIVSNFFCSKQSYIEYNTLTCSDSNITKLR